MNNLILAAALAAATIANPAFAHTQLKSATPADGSIVAAAPAEFVLSFNEAAKVTAVTIQKEGGTEQKISALPTATAAQARIPAPKLDNGRYTLTWRAVGGDGHVVNGKLNFTIGGKPSPGTAPHDAHPDHADRR